MRKKTLETMLGDRIEIDTSDQALIRLGYRKFIKNRNLIDPDGDEVVLEGVAFGDGRYRMKKVAWFSFPTEGLGFFYPDPTGPDDFKVKENKWVSISSKTANTPKRLRQFFLIQKTKKEESPPLFSYSPNSLIILKTESGFKLKESISFSIRNLANSG